MPTQDFKGTINAVNPQPAATGFTIAGGTTSKTITVDETGAMSAKAAKTQIVGGDGTAGRVLRVARVEIENGTTVGDYLKLTLTNLWNGDALATVDNIGKGTATGNWLLNAGGTALTLANALFTANGHGVLVAVISSNNNYNASGVALSWTAALDATGIIMYLRDELTGTLQDFTALVNVGAMHLTIAYLTSA